MFETVLRPRFKKIFSGKIDNTAQIEDHTSMSFDYYHQQNKKHTDGVQTVDAYDTENKYSMIKMAPEWLRERMLHPAIKELMLLDEEDLSARVRPNLTLKRLRTAFWHEYEHLHRNYGRIAADKNKISMHRVATGVCTLEYLTEKIMPNDLYVAWIIRPPVNYENAMEEALQHGLNRMREILNFPLYKAKYNRDGLPIVDKYSGEVVYEPDATIANLMLKTVAYLDLRIKGATTQKIHQISQQQISRQNINYNVRNGANDRVTVDMGKLDDKLLTIDDLDTKIAALSKETQDIIDNPSFTNKEIKSLHKQSENELDEHTIEIAHPNE